MAASFSSGMTRAYGAGRAHACSPLVDQVGYSIDCGAKADRSLGLSACANRRRCLIARFGEVNSLCKVPSFLCSRVRESTLPISTSSLSPIRLVRKQHIHAVLLRVRRTRRLSNVRLASRRSGNRFDRFPIIYGPRRSRMVFDLAGSNLSQPYRLQYAFAAALPIILLPFLHRLRRVSSRGYPTSLSCGQALILGLAPDRESIGFLIEGNSSNLHYRVTPNDILVYGYDVLHQRSAPNFRFGTMSLPKADFSVLCKTFIGREFLENSPTSKLRK